MDKRDELLIRILDAPARIEQRNGRLRRKIGHHSLRVAKCIAADGGIFEHLL